MRLPSRTLRSILLILFIVAVSAVAALPGSSAARAKKNSPPDNSSKAVGVELAAPVEFRQAAPSLPVAPRLKTAGLGFTPLAVFQVSFADSVSTFDADCTTPKVSWTLGNEVCVKVSGPLDASNVLRRLRLVNPAGLVVGSVDVTTNPQTVTFTLPSNATTTFNGLLNPGSDTSIDNRGTWQIISTNTSDGSVAAFASITVHDPVKIVADLQISKSLTEDSTATAGANIKSVIWVFNAGPDDAQSVSVSDATPANTTFQSLIQTAGPTFTCTTPAVNSVGTSVCQPDNMTKSLAKGDAAGFIVTYKVSSSIANGSDLSSTASVTSSTEETNASNNSSDETVPASNSTPPTCSLTCPSNITQDNDTGQAGAIVTYTAPSTSGTCGAVTTDHPSGTFFPIGTTIVTTNVADGSPTGVSCSFAVTVLDKRTVAVTLNGSPEMTVECRTGFSDPGATATGNAPITTTITVPSGQVDPSNGDPINPTTVPAVDPNAPNTYTITYSATIGSNTATATRIVHVVDTTPPDITLNGTAGLTPVSTQVTVTNDDGTTSTVTETILVGTVECHTSFTAPTASATDGCDNHAVTVTTSGAVDVNTPGNYEIVYAATDAAGNDADRRVRVTVVDTTPPVITISTGPTTVECHSAFSNPTATATDGCAGTVPVTATGSVNPNVPDTYTVSFTATDPSGNTATASRTVTVVDTTPPTVTMNGAASVTIILGSSFTDPGATATDGCAGPLPVTTTGTVNTNAVGTYTITYTATDPSGNTGTATRTVKVIYNFTGFFSPVSNAPTLNVVNAGRAVPVKFSLSGNKGLSIFAVNSPSSGQVTCGTSTQSDVQDTTTAGSSSLSYDAGSSQYNYVWKTESSWAGQCRVLNVTLNDGTVHTALFKFK
ncbi:MAG: hypothetical protein QOC99_904 [Acidobacteriota bacterium]|jgi:hypothetical protein|nr:hypothetical protein [Acidobacteriota bacterium]